MIKFGSENNTITDAPFLLKMKEGEDNCVRFIIAFSMKGEVREVIDDMEIQGLGQVLQNATPIVPNSDEVYEITFQSYILHQIRNESFCSQDEYEIRNGRYCILFEKSRLLDMLLTITDCQRSSDGAVYPGEWKHYGIYCQNHIIDVISHNEPVIKKLGNKASDM